MNDEIKEILDFKENADYKKLSCDEIKVLKDYITNLQEKYDKALTDLVHESHKRIEIENKITNLQQENEKLEKHKEYYKNETKRLGKLFYITKEENIKLEEAQKNFEKQFIKEMDYKSRIEKAVEYIETRIDSSKAGKWELLNILNGDKSE